jgi:hypothetical protein
MQCDCPNIINQNKTFQVIEVLDYIEMLYKAYKNSSQIPQHSYFHLILQLCLDTNFINNFKKCQEPSNDNGFTTSEVLFNMLRYFIRENTDSGKDIVQQGLEIIFSDNVTSLLIQMTQHPYYQQTNSLNETLEDLSDHLSELKILQTLMQGQNKRTFLPALQLVTFKLQDSEIKFCIEEILSKMGVDFKDDHIIEQFLDLGFKLQENTELRSQQKLNLLAACLANPKIEVTKPYANKPDDINPIISAAIANCGPNVITCIPFTENGQPKAIISIPKQIGRKNLILTADEQNSSILAAATSRQKFIQFLHVDNTNAKPAKRDKYLLNVKNKLDALGLYPKSSSMLRSNLSYALILLTLETKQFNHALEQLSSKTIEQIAFAAMQTSLGFFTSQRQIQFFIRNIIMQRDSAALFSYGVSLSRAPANIASEAYPRFKSFIQSVCSPNAVEFYNHRYDIKGNQHLQALNNLSAIFFMAWQQRYSLPLEKVYDIFKLQNATKQIDIRKFLFNVVVNHKHLPQTQPFDMVYSYFTDNDNHNRALIRKNLKNLLKDTTSRQHKEHKYVQAIIYLYELDKTDKNNKLRLIQCALSQRIHYELNNDLMALFRSLASNDYSMQNIDLGKYTISLTNEPYILTRLGEDVAGSCQRLRGNAQLNYALLGYILSGHVAAIVITDQSKKICCRAIVRVCIDDTAQAPVLQIDRIYSSAHYNIFADAIYAFAKMLGLKLNCTVVASESLADASYPNRLSIKHLESPEYVDALHGIQYVPYSLGSMGLLFNYNAFKDSWLQRLLEHEKTAQRLLNENSVARYSLTVIP